MFADSTSPMPAWSAAGGHDRRASRRAGPAGIPRAPGAALGAALAALVAFAPSALAQGPSTSPQESGVPAASPGASSPGAPSVSGDPAADLWLMNGTTLVRVDGTTGALVATRDVAVPHCQWNRSFGPLEGAMWLTSSGAPGYASQVDQMMGIPNDPDERFCIGRYPIDGTEAQVSFVDIPEHTALFIASAASIDGVLWLAAAMTPEEGGVIGGRNSHLYRFDAAASTLVPVVKGVLDVAEANRRLWVVQDPKGTGWPRPGVIDPGSDRIGKVDFKLKRYDSVDSVDGGEGLVTFGGARYNAKAKGSKAWGATIFSIDPATGDQFTSRPMKVSDAGFGSHTGAASGIYADNRDVQGLAFVPATNGGKVTRVGARCKSASKPGARGCDVRIAGVTPGAVWVVRSTSDGDTRTAVYERYDRATGELTVAVPSESVIPAP